MQALVARSRELRAVDADPESTAVLLVQDCHIRVVGLFLQCEVESAFGQRALTSTLAVVGVDHSDLPRPKFHRAPRPTPANQVVQICQAMALEGIPCKEIGKVERGKSQVWIEIDGKQELLPYPERDEIARVFESA